MIYRQLEDPDQRELALGRAGLRPNIPMTFLVLQGLAAYVSNRINSEPASLIAFIVSSALFGIAAYLVQRTANDYLKIKYPTYRRME